MFKNDVLLREKRDIVVFYSIVSELPTQSQLFLFIVLTEQQWSKHLEASTP